MGELFINVGRQSFLKQDTKQWNNKWKKMEKSDYIETLISTIKDKPSQRGHICKIKNTHKELTPTIFKFPEASPSSTELPSMSIALHSTPALPEVHWKQKRCRKKQLRVHSQDGGSCVPLYHQGWEKQIVLGSQNKPHWTQFCFTKLNELWLQGKHILQSKEKENGILPHSV
jgi:hypothetical protein